MATMYVTEYAGLGASDNGDIMQAVCGPPLAEQTVAISGVSAACAALQSKTRIVRVHVDVIASVNVGGAVATTASQRMVAGQTEYFRVIPAASQRINVISNT